MEGPTARLRIRVSPGAARSEIVGRHGAGWKIRVAAAPERGRANAVVRDLLVRALDVSRERVELVAGQGSRDKVVSIRGLTAHDVDARLDAVSSPERQASR